MHKYHVHVALSQVACFLLIGAPLNDTNITKLNREKKVFGKKKKILQVKKRGDGTVNLCNICTL